MKSGAFSLNRALRARRSSARSGGLQEKNLKEAPWAAAADAISPALAAALGSAVSSWLSAAGPGFA
jgi:hypothetical protein